MKKLLCIVLSLLMIAAMTITAFSATADVAETGAGVLKVTVNGKNPVNIEVGNEFIVRVGLYAGSLKILNGQVHLDYDPAKLSLDPYYGPDDDEMMEAYSFPAAIVPSVVINYDDPGIINYNFTKAKGIDVFDSTDKLFSRFRFKATAAGSTDIAHVIEYMINANNERIYYSGQPSTVINPYTAITIEAATACIGDANNDKEVTILDATYMQRVAAGADLAVDTAIADLTGDHIVSLKDAIIVRKYLSGMAVNSNVGEYQFANDPA